MTSLGRLGNVSLGPVFQNVLNIKTCSAFSILMNESWEYKSSNWHLAESLPGGVLGQRK